MAFSVMGTLGISVFGYDPWGLVDAGLFGIIACGSWRRSRIAALAGFTIFVVGRLYMSVQYRTGIGGIVLSFIIGLLLFHGLRGTFAYRKFRLPVTFGGLVRAGQQASEVERHFKRITWIVSLVLIGLSALGGLVALAGWLSAEIPSEDVFTFAGLAGGQ